MYKLNLHRSRPNHPWYLDHSCCLLAAVCVFCSTKINPLQTLQQHHFLLFRALLEMAVMIRGTKVPVVQWFNYDSNVFKVFNVRLLATSSLCKNKKVKLLLLKLSWTDWLQLFLLITFTVTLKLVKLVMQADSQYVV